MKNEIEKNERGKERDKNIFFIKPSGKTLFPQTPNVAFLFKKKKKLLRQVTLFVPKPKFRCLQRKCLENETLHRKLAFAKRSLKEHPHRPSSLKRKDL